jgi:F-type H+-transporting ATPase subunit epsilon
MRLKVLLPTRILIDQDATKITAEAENGSFCILPHHIDFVAALVPGILFFNSNSEDEFLAVDEGILVKLGNEVMVSIRKAVRGKNLGTLKQTVEEEFRIIDEKEKKTRSILVKLELDFARHIFQLREHG